MHCGGGGMRTEAYARIFQTTTAVVQGTTHLPEAKRNAFKGPVPPLEHK
jgi:hypothetical protein